MRVCREESGPTNFVEGLRNAGSFAETLDVRPRFAVGDTVMVLLPDTERPRQVGDIVGASGVVRTSPTWVVRLGDASLVELADGQVLDRVTVGRYACPCCGFLTILSVTGGPPGTYVICPVCRWEDDLLQPEAPDVGAGANRVNLMQARADFEQWRDAGMPKHERRRPPRPEERP